MIIVDSREPSSIVSKLKGKDLDIKEEFIEVGDYLLDDGYAIERKAKDLIPSILSNRLYDQLNNLCDSYEHPVLCIVLDNMWKTFYFTKGRYIHKSYYGTLTTLTTKYPKLKLIFLNDEDEFVNYLDYLDKKIHKEGSSKRPAPAMRKARSMRITRENALCSIKGVSVKKSQQLLDCYGCIKNIANCSEEELTKTPGIGPKLAHQIWEVFN